ncbi:MAG: rhodanese-like domain-containing protein [Gammaproteobacteria bacterium]|nr:MAG: rhodanese-like domain-containing protein [Gammaproteobacteria bacterium]
MLIGAMQQFIEFVVNHWVLWSLFTGLLVALVWNLLAERMGGIPQLGPLEATRLINDEDAAVIDLRGEAAFRKGHLLNAINIPAGELERRMNELERLREKPVILSCETGPAAIAAARRLRQAGFARVHVLRGGIAAWRSAGLPLAKA